MKIGSCAMSRVCVINASLVWCGVVMAMFALYQAARRYAIRCLRRVFRFDPATICLAQAFVFSTAVGAMAQSITITADAGPDRTVASGATVTLDGSGSTASDGTTLYYIWIIFDDSAEHVPGFSSRSGKVQTFTAPNLEPGAADVTISFILQVRDRPGFIGGVSSGDTVTITVEAPNAPPVPNAGPDQTIKPGRKVTLDGTGSTDDDRIASYSWNRTGGTCTETTVFGGVSSLTGTNALPSFTAETLASGVASCTHDFKLFVTDNDGVLGGTGDSVTVTIIATAENQRPIARVGANQTVASGTGFLLDGVGSTDDGAIGEYEWWRLDPSTGDIGLLVRNPGSITGVFVTEDILPGDADIVFTYYLNVKDNEGTSCEKQIAGGNNGELFCDSVAVTVTAPFATPVARAVTAESEYSSGATVTLDGSGSSVDRRRGPISHAWERTDGTTGGSVTLSDAKAAKPTFTADTLAAGAEDVIHIFTLTVTDNEGATDTDTVTVTVEAPDVPNAGPIANPGSNQTVASGATVTLDGSGSTTSPGRTITWYAWGVNDSSVSGCDDPPPSLSNAPLDGEARLSFTAEVLESGAEDVIYCIDLSVRDSAGGRSPFVRVKVTVEAPPANKAPVANAGPDQTIKPGRTVTLDGTGSTDDDRITSYSWNRTGGTCTVTTVFGGVSSLTGTNALPSFTAETLASGIASCTHDFKLFVTDNDGVLDGTGDSVTVTIIATAENQPPIARGGANQTVASGATVTLDGRLSSDDGSIATFLWNANSPDQVKIPPTDWRNATTATPSFTAETLESGAEDVIYYFSLRVQDNEGLWSNIDHMTVTVEALDVPKSPPVANAGPDQLEVVSGTTVQLNGSGSSVDPRRTATYSWVRTGGTTGGMVTFSPSATVESPTFPTDTLTESDSDVTHIFTLTVKDGEGGMATDMVTIIVKAPVPVPDTTGPKATTFTALGLAQNNHDGMTPINFQVVFDEPVLGFTAEDIARNPWNVPDTEDVATHTATISKFMIDPTNPLRYTFTLTPGVDSSGSGSRLAFTVVIPQDKLTDATGNKNKNKTIRGPHLTYSAPSTNIRPVAHAGVDQTKRHGELVTLDGSGSMDPDGLPGEMLKYSWARTGVTTGVTVNLNDTKAKMPTFTANAPPGTVNVVHIFTLTVTDEGGLIDTDTVKVVILSPFLTLTANAGVDQEVVSGATVTLDGSASIVDGRTSIAQYSWARTGGTGGTVTLNPSATVVRPTFTADTLAEGAADVTHIFTLTVTDNEDNTSVDTVTITVTAPVPADTTAPTAMFEGPTTHDGKTPFDMAFVFSEPVVGFMADDVVRTPYDLPSSAIVSNYRPAISNFRKDSTNALRYTFTLTPEAPNALYSPYDFDVRIPRHRLTDGAGNQNERIVGPIVIYSNVDPVANAGTDQTVTSEAMVELDGSGSTDNGTIASHAWVRTGGTTGGSVTLSDTKVAKPTFTADALAAGANNVIHIFTLTVTDNEGATDTDTVTVTVEAPDAPRVAAAGDDQTVAAGATVTLDGSGSTVVNGPISKYNWTRESGTSTRTTIFATDSGGTTNQREISTPTTTFVADSVPANGAAVTHVIALRVLDANGIPSPKDEITVTVNPNQLPIANAGVDRSFDSGVKVTLEGSGTDSDSDATLTYSWAWTSGTGASVTLTDADKATASFTANALTPGAADATHTFTLTVTDNNGESSTDTVTITVTAPDAPFAVPVAMIAGGDRELASGATVQLDGSGSTHDSRTTLTYSWARTGGSSLDTGTLTDAMTDKPSFTAETRANGAEDVTHFLTLTVTDNEGGTDAATVTITVTSGFADPVAKAGPAQTGVNSGTVVTLDGRGSTVDSRRTPLSYAWTRPSGTEGGTGGSVTLTGADTAQPTFMAETLTPGAEDVTYIFQLIVTDDDGAGEASEPDTVEITVTSPFEPTVARAGDDRTVASGAPVTLDGNGSTSDRRFPIGEYEWERTGGTEGATVDLTNANMATASFTAPTLSAGAEDETHIFTLTVTDRDGDRDTDMVTITVTAGNVPPVAMIAGGNRSVTSGTVVTLVGSGTDQGGTIKSYAWTRTGGTGNNAVPLTGATTAELGFTADTLAVGAENVTHIFTLIVTDNDDAMSAPATVTITVTAPLAPLVAHAGADKSVASEATVTLDGTGSTLTVGVRTVTYAWARTGGTGDDTVAPSNPAALQTSFTAETLNPGDASVTHIFTLTVTDNQGSTQATDTVTFTVTALAALVAEAGTDQTVDSGTRNVELDGTGSTETVGVRTVTYAWARTGGTGDDTVAPSNPAALQTSFTAETLNPGDASVTHIFTLTVTDNQGSTQATDTVTFTVTAPLAALVAEAGTDQTVDSGTRNVELDGTGSTETVGVRTVTYAWARTGGTGDDTVAPSNPAALQTSFTAETLNPGDASVTHIFTLTVTDNQGSTQATDTVTFTVTAPLAALVAEAGTDQTVDSGTRNVELDGTGSTETVGVRTVTYAWARTGGTGDDTVAPSNPAALQTSFTAETLNPGDASVTHIFTLTVTDNQGSTQATDTVTFTVTAPLAALVAEAGTDQTVDSGTRNVELDGTGSTETVGVRTVTYAWARTGGTGDDTVAPSNPAALQTSFTAETLNPGDASVTHIFTLTVTDNQGSTQATDTVTFTVTAPLAALVAEAGTDQTVDSGTRNVELDGTGSTETVGVRTVTYAWARTGGTGDDTVAPSNPAALQTSFTAETLNPGDASVTHIFTLTVTDNQGSTQATDTVTFTVTAPLAALVAEAGTDQTVDSGTRNVELDGTGSTETVGVRTVTYAWARTGGTGDDTVAPSNPAALQTSFTAETLNPGDASVTHIFTLTVTDNQGSTQATDTVTFTVTAPLAALVAEAGTDQTVDSGTRNVELDGTGSTETVGVRTVTYAWARTGGTGDDTVAPSNPAALQTSFTAETLNPGDASVTHIFTLTVTDNQGSTQATDTVTFTVTAPLAALVAEAGTDQTVDSGTRNVELDGTGSTETVGVRTVTYAWARTGGTGDDTVAPSNPAALQTSFTAETLNPGDASVTHIFTLTVTDNQGSTQATDTVTFTVTAPLAALVAEAGTDQTVDSGTRNVELDGTGSTETVGVRTVTYAWARTGGTGDDTVAPSNPAALQTSFTAETLNPGDASVTHIFTLTVTDNQGSTQATDTVTFTVTAPLAALVAEAGTDQTVDSGTRNVELDGTGSTETVGVRTVTYAWARTGGTGDDTVAPSNPAALQTSFTAETLNPGDASVTHIFTLTVTDNQGSTQATDTVTFTVTAPLAALVAEAGTDQTVDSGTRNVELDGTGSTETVGVRTVTYAWARTGGTGDDTVAPSNPAALQTSFTAETLNPGDASVTHIFTLTVTDNQGSTQATDTVTFTVTAPLAALVAEAGTDQTVDSGTRNVELDGTGSTETVGVRTVTYAWARTGGTGDDTVAPSNPAALQTSFTAETLNPGAADVTHIFTLTVTDSDGVTAVDTVTITVTAPPFAALVAQAGDPQTVGSGATVTLDGSGSTGSDINRTVTYAWERTGGAVGATAPLTSANTLEPTFKADTLAPGANAVTHIFTLTVTDNAGSTEATDTVTITVNARSVVRIVNPAGPDGTIQAAPGALVTLVGSVDPDVDVESYLWRRTGGTGDPNVVLNGADTATLMFTADTADTAQASFVANTPEPDVPDVNHSFTLTVKDKGGVRHTSDRVTVRVSSVAQVDVDIRVLRPIGGYLETRATALLNTQPDLTRFLEQDGTIPGGSGDFTFQATNGRVALDGGFIRDGVWGQVTGSYASSDSGDVKSVLGSFGFHRKYSERFLAGAMLQFDLADHDLARQAGMIDGTGWLVGPYFAARNGKRPLYFEGRLLYGQSDNDIRFSDPGTGIGVRNGSFDTKRLLAQLRVQGEIALSDENGGPRLIPYADARWVEDRAVTFTTVSATGLRNSVPGQKVSVGQLELGSNVEVPIAMSHGAMTFTGGLGLVYSNTEGDFIPSVSRSRGRGEIGLSYGLDDNVQIDFESFYDGIGTSGYEGYGLSLRAEMKF